MGGDIAAENRSPGEGSERPTCTSDPQKRLCPADLGRVVQVLHLYSGSRRRGVLGRALRRQGRKEGLCVVTRELDLLKGSPRHGLNACGRQQRVIAEIRTGRFHCIVVSPPAGGRGQDIAPAHIEPGRRRPCRDRGGWAGRGDRSLGRNSSWNFNDIKPPPVLSGVVPADRRRVGWSSP